MGTLSSSSSSKVSASRPKMSSSPLTLTPPNRLTDSSPRSTRAKMDRRMGMESMMGYTKGLLSPASAKLETRGQEFKRAGQNERACEAFLSAVSCS